MNLSQNFVALDIETANEARSSICQIAIAIVENGEITTVKDWYIKPKDCRFGIMNSYIHGITISTVLGCPEFDQVWFEIYPLIKDRLVVVHNASFDIYSLNDTLHLYEIKDVAFNYCCTLQEAKQRYQLNKYSLPVLCKTLEIEFNEHHNAKYDALACAMIAIKMGLTLPPKEYPFHDRLPYVSTTPIPYNFKAALPKADLTDINIYDLSVVVTPDMFKGKRIVVTGQFDKISRPDAEEYITKMGALICSSISKNTSLVVMGSDAGPSKIERVKDLNKTCFIPVIDENEFIEVLVALTLL